MNLVFKENNQEIANFKIKEGQTLSVGRGVNNDITCRTPTVSSKHLEVLFENGKVLIIDLQSTNGTFVNKQRIQSYIPTPVSENDKVYLGKDNFKMTIGASPKSEPINKTIVIGRSQNCDVVLDDQMISRCHASIRKIEGNRFEVIDLNSTNGTFFQGKKISKEILSATDNFIIGKYVFNTNGQYKRIDAQTVVKLDRVSKTFSNNKTVIHPLSLEIYPKTLTAIMGPSGCGKSTLLKMMNGMVPNSTGDISLFDLNLNQYYNYFKNQIGYVPQDDTIHEELTVYQSIYFAAKLRLESLSDIEIENKISDLLLRLKISHIRDHKNSEISGGQRKRVCIAIELLSEPMLLLLDEPTSPLDPQSIGSFMEILKELAHMGTTIVLVTHKPEDLEFMDEVIFLSENGHLAFKGKTKNYLDFFNASSTVDVYNLISGENADKWANSDSNYILSTRNERNIDEKIKANWLRQLYWLTNRNLMVKANDQLNLAITILEAPIIGILIGSIFKDLSIGVLFMMVISSIWFGVNNAAREIVKEQSIFVRERLFNLYNGTYLLSKLLTLLLIGLIQTALFVSVISIMYYSTENPLNSSTQTFIWLWFINSISATAGLLLSAAMKSTDKVLALVPIILIPQLMLSGVITKIHSGFVELLSYLTFSRWGTEGLAHIQKTIRTNDRNYKLDIDGNPIKSDSGELVYESLEVNSNALDFIHEQYHTTYTTIYPNLSGTFTLDIIVNLVLASLIIVITYILLRKKTG